MTEFIIRFGYIVTALVFLSGLVGEPPFAASDVELFAEGFVYHDENGNQKRDDGEAGIESVLVSNGESIVETDEEGRFRIGVTDQTILFVIKPRDWTMRFSGDQLPLFHYIHRPEGSPDYLDFPGISPTGSLPERIDFPLYPQDEPESYRIVVFGDPQVRNLKEVEYLARDVIPQLVGTDAKFGVTLGDLAFDDLRMFEPLNRVVSMVGIPWFNVHGNHDMNYKALDDTHAADTYKRVYGPTNFSYNYGPVHFIALDNVEKGSGHHYRGYLNEQQLAFIKADLSYLDPDQLIVIMFHIPIRGMANRQAFFDVLKGHDNVFVLSAHAHIQAHQFYDREAGWHGEKPLHELVHVTACGNWWGGELDENGIPHTTMKDGVPNGWSYVEFDGNRYSVEYHPARRPSNYQMDILAPSSLERDEVEHTEMQVNVFGGSVRSKVEMKFGQEGEWVVLEKVADKLHLWKTMLPANPPRGMHIITVRTTTMFGQIYSAHHLIDIR